MRQYEKNIDVVMPIRNFGKFKEDKEIKFCKLKAITEVDGLMYFIELYTENMELLGARWITRNMYRYHVMNKPYC